MKSVHGLFLLLFALLPLSDNGNLAAQTPVLVRDSLFQESARAAIDSLYNANPEAAREILAPWKQSWPDHPVWALMDGMELWWDVLNDLFDDSHDEALIAQMSLADKQASDLLDEQPDHPDALITRAVANGYIARQYSNRNRWMASIRVARRAMNAHEAFGEVAPDISDNLFAEGLKKYYSAYLPEAYPVIRAVAWLLPSGDKELGLNLLKVTSEEAIFARPEAIYFMGNILLNYEEEPTRAIEYFSRLVRSYPRNSYYRRLHVRALYGMEANEEALQAIERALTYWDENQLPGVNVLREELLYWSGRIKMRTSLPSIAFRDLDASFQAGKGLPNRPARSFHVLSGYYAGLTAEWAGESGRARGFYESIIDLDAERPIRRLAEERLDDLVP